jgi:putative ABC transport system substrate-binding protein
MQRAFTGPLFANVRVETRLAGGDARRAPALAAELGESGAQVFVSLGAIGVFAVRETVPNIPVVFAGVLDPVAAGLTTSLERPDRNVTGITTFDAQQQAMQMRMMQAIKPGLKRIAIVSDLNIPRSNGVNPLEDANERAAREQGLHVEMVRLVGPTPDLEGACAKLDAAQVEAIVVLDVPVPVLHRQRIAELARAKRLASLFLGGRRMADAGGLVAYGSGLPDAVPLVPAIVARILNGEKPAQIPFQSVTRKTLIVNLATARALGITLPADLVAQATETIK